MTKCTSEMNNAKEDHVVMQIQNIINYSLVVMTNSNGMTLLHMTINGHTLMTRYSEKLRGVEGRPKTRSQNPMGNAPLGTKTVRYDCSHFVWNDLSDMTMFRTRNGVSHLFILLPDLVRNPSHFSVFSL